MPYLSSKCPIGRIIINVLLVFRTNILDQILLREVKDKGPKGVSDN